MDRFSKYNPKTCFLFFAAQIVLSLILFNPFYLAVSFIAAFLYSIKLRGGAAVKKLFCFVLPLILFIALFNMLFSRYGVTVLFSLWGYDFTLEAFFYGFNQGVMFGAVIFWIDCYCDVMSSERFLAVFSRIAPNFSLVFSMVLSFLPRLRKNAREIDDAHFLLNSGKGKLARSLSTFSALISMTLEESIEVADSMRARGFNKDRKAYSKYSFFAGDAVVCAAVAVLSALTAYYILSGSTEFIFEPEIYIEGFSVLSLALFAVLSLLPLIIDLSEDVKWLYLKRKI